jgi:hypothetical protein
MDRGSVKYSILRKDTIVENGHVLRAASLSLATVIVTDVTASARTTFIVASSSAPTVGATTVTR